MASELILEWGQERRSPKGREGRGQPAPPHQLGVCGSAVSFLSEVEGFSCILTVRLLFPASQYVLHTVCMARYQVFLGGPGYTYQYPPHKQLGCQISCIPLLPAPVPEPLLKVSNNYYFWFCLEVTSLFYFFHRSLQVRRGCLKVSHRIVWRLLV